MLPDGFKMVRPDWMHVYVVQCGKYCKVGISAKLMQRVKSFSTDNPHPVSLVHHLKVDRPFARKVEALAHKLLEEQHHSNEWFKCAPEKAVVAVNAADRAVSEKARNSVTPLETLSPEERAEYEIVQARWKSLQDQYSRAESATAKSRYSRIES